MFQYSAENGNLNREPVYLSLLIGDLFCLRGHLAIAGCILPLSNRIILFQPGNRAHQADHEVFELLCLRGNPWHNNQRGRSALDPCLSDFRGLRRRSTTRLAIDAFN